MSAVESVVEPMVESNILGSFRAPGVSGELLRRSCLFAGFVCKEGMYGGRLGGTVPEKVNGGE